MLALAGRTTGAFRRDGRDMDAMIMEETDEDLKDKVGSAAHFVPAGKALGRLPVRMTVQLDTNRPVRRHAMLCVIGNVGTLRGNLTLIPGASPDDGLLDLYIASPRRFRHWAKLALRLITRRPKTASPCCDRWTSGRASDHRCPPAHAEWVLHVRLSGMP
jgi:hypothetical protein